MPSSLDLKTTGKWFALSALVGAVSGLGAIAFQLLLQLVMRLALAGIAGYEPAEPLGEASWFRPTMGDLSLWKLVLVMMGGGLISGWIVYTFAPEAEGHGTDAAIDAFHNKRGHIRPRIPLVKMLASAITLGTGGSGGREGPIAQIGAGFGSLLASRLKLSARDRRILLAAGMGAGVGAIFRAPLAGALFAAEILYREAEFEADVIIPAAIASIIAYSVYALSLPARLMFTPLFGSGLQFTIGSLGELVPLTLLAVVLVAAGVIYIKVFYGTAKLFRKAPVLPHLRPLIGAGLAALLGIALYGALDDPTALAVLATGYGAVQKALDPAVEMGIWLPVLIALGKIVTTSLTIGSGGSGGVFGPSMVIGGCLGAAVGEGLHSLWPEAVSQPKAYVIIGMAGFFSGCAHAPISTLIMVTEMTGDYKLLIPAMWVCTICFILGRRWSLYEKQVPTRLESPAHRGDFIVDVLEGIRVDEVFRPGRPLRLIPESATLDHILHTMAQTSQNYFPVVDSEERLIGIFSTNDVRAFTYDEAMWNVAIARDIMVADVLSVRPGDDLNTALRRFTQRNIDELPVLDPEDSGKLLGMLRRKDVIAFYNQRLAAQKSDRES